MTGNGKIAFSFHPKLLDTLKDYSGAKFMQVLVAGVTVGLTGVNNTTDGTGNGFILYPGDEVFLAVTNTNLVFINGTTGDIVSFQGN